MGHGGCCPLLLTVIAAACSAPGNEHEFDLTVYPTEPVIGEEIDLRLTDRCAYELECHPDTFQIHEIHTSGAAVVRDTGAFGSERPTVFAAGLPGHASITVEGSAVDKTTFDFWETDTAEVDVVMPDDVQGRVSCTGPGDAIPAGNDLSVSYTMFLRGVQRSGAFDTTPIIGAGFEVVRETRNNAVLRIPTTVGPVSLSVSPGTWTRALEIYDPATVPLAVTGTIGALDPHLNAYDLTLDLDYGPDLEADACNLPVGGAVSATPSVCTMNGGQTRVIALSSGQCTLNYQLVGADQLHPITFDVTAVPALDRPWDATCTQSDGKTCGLVCDEGVTSMGTCRYSLATPAADCSTLDAPKCRYTLDMPASSATCPPTFELAAHADLGFAVCWMP